MTTVEERAKDILETAKACQRCGWNPESVLWCTSTHKITLQHLLDISDLLAELEQVKSELDYFKTTEEQISEIIYKERDRYKAALNIISTAKGWGKSAEVLQDIAKKALEETL
jgi:hypothetical protein